MKAKKSQVPGSLQERLSMLRKAKGLSQREIARVVGVAESNYREWEYGRAIQGEPYLKLAEALGVSAATLLGGSRPSERAIITTFDQIEKNISDLKKHLISVF